MKNWNCKGFIRIVFALLVAWGGFIIAIKSPEMPILEAAQYACGAMVGIIGFVTATLLYIIYFE